MLCVRNLIILLITIASAFTASGENPTCAKKRLDVKPGAFFLTEPRDQEDGGVDSGMCYAAVAAQMYDACRKVEDGRNDETSIVATAIEFTSTKANHPDLNKGNVTEAIAALESMGSCPTALFDEREAGLFKTERMIAGNSPLAPCPSKFRDSNNLGSIATFSQTLDQAAWNRLAHETKKRLLVSGLNKICPANQRLRSSCSAPKGLMWHTNLETSHEIVAESLRRGLPVSLVLGGHMLRTGKADYTDRSNQHAVLVVGSQMNGKSCEYLIRNSYGPDCHGVSPSFPTCKEGQMWIPVETIDAGTASVTYFPAHED